MCTSHSHKFLSSQFMKYQSWWLPESGIPMGELISMLRGNSRCEISLDSLDSHSIPVGMLNFLVRFSDFREFQRI